MNILITGANGQLGNELRVIAPLYKNFNFTFTDIGELDITNYEALRKFFSKNKFQCIINAAAYTAVDKAESERKEASLLNSTAVKYLAEFSASIDSLFVHISTDYVFDGKNHKPYTEGDLTNPKSIYGKTKLEGEVEVVFSSHKAVIIRTSWLYSSFGNNFVKTIMRIAKEKPAINVVCDQIGTPTYAKDLAIAVLEIIGNYQAKNKCEVYNFANEGVASWYDFAKEITEIANIPCIVNPIETKDYPTPAARPYYSALNKTKIKNQFNITIPHWKDSLKACIKLLIEKE